MSSLLRLLCLCCPLVQCHRLLLDWSNFLLPLIHKSVGALVDFFFLNWTKAPTLIVERREYIFLESFEWKRLQKKLDACQCLRSMTGTFSMASVETERVTSYSYSDSRRSYAKRVSGECNFLERKLVSEFSCRSASCFCWNWYHLAYVVSSKELRYETSDICGLYRLNSR
jgi:hypothetical protein